MRKSKEVKAMKREAGFKYKQGKEKEAYTLWKEAEERKAEIAKAKEDHGTEQLGHISS